MVTKLTCGMRQVAFRAMRRPATIGVPLFAVALLAPMTAHAGMSMPKLTDIVSARLEVISFFLVGCLVLAFVYQRLWSEEPAGDPEGNHHSRRSSPSGWRACCGVSRWFRQHSEGRR